MSVEEMRALGEAKAALWSLNRAIDAFHRAGIDNLVIKQIRDDLDEEIDALKEDMSNDSPYNR